MEPNMYSSIKELLELAKENNKILRKINNRARIAMITSFLYWAIIIGLTVGAFYYLQPFLSAIMDNYQKSMTLLDSVQTVGGNLPDFTVLPSLFPGSTASSSSSTMLQAVFEYLKSYWPGN